MSRPASSRVDAPTCPEPLICCGHDGRVLRLTPAARHAFGDDLIGRGLCACLRLRHPDDDTALGWVELTAATLPVTVLLRSLQDERAPFLRVPLAFAPASAPTDWDAAERCFLCLDRAERDQLRLRARVLEVISDGVTINRADGDLETLSANTAFQRLTGYPASEIIGRNLRFVQGDETDQPALVPLREALAAEEAVEVVLRNRRRRRPNPGLHRHRSLRRHQRPLRSGRRRSGPARAGDTLARRSARGCRPRPPRRRRAGDDPAPGR